MLPTLLSLVSQLLLTYQLLLVSLVFPPIFALHASELGVLVASVNTVIIIHAISHIIVKNVNGSLTQDF